MTTQKKRVRALWAALSVLSLAVALPFQPIIAQGPTTAPASAPETPATPPPAIKIRERQTPPYVVLKLDDLGTTGKGSVPLRWKKVVEFLRERNIKCAIGIICASLEGDKPEYFRWLKEVQATGMVEFWDHGYDHREWEENGTRLWEFRGTSAEFQRDHLRKNQALAREKLGFELQTFGAPSNQTDAATVTALAQVPEIKIWLYGNPKTPAGKVVLERPAWLGIESPLFVPNLERFLRPYNNHFNTECLVLQGHAAQWDDARFAEFVKIIDFLTEQKAVFVTPTEYVQQKKLAPQ